MSKKPPEEELHVILNKDDPTTPERRLPLEQAKQEAIARLNKKRAARPNINNSSHL